MEYKISIYDDDDYRKVIIFIDLEEVDLESLTPLFYLRNIRIKGFAQSNNKLTDDIKRYVELFYIDSKNATSTLMAMYISSFTSNYDTSRLSLFILSRNSSQTMVECNKSMYPDQHIASYTRISEIINIYF